MAQLMAQLLLLLAATPTTPTPAAIPTTACPALGSIAEAAAERRDSERPLARREAPSVAAALLPWRQQRTR